MYAKPGLLQGPQLYFFVSFKSKPELDYDEVLSESGSHLRLQVGLAHIVKVGDEYALCHLCPLITSENSSAQLPEISHRAQVTRVQGLTSDRIEIDVATNIATSSGQANHSAKARSTIKKAGKLYRSPRFPLVDRS